MPDEGLSTGRGIIRFDCPRCLATIKVPASQGGRSSKCPKCEKRLTIPERERDEPEPEELRVEDENLELAPEPDHKPCRHCGEQVKANAAKCRHCQRWINKPADVWADEREERMLEQEERGTGLVPILFKIYGVLIMVVGGLGILGTILNFSIIGLLVNIVIVRLGHGLYKAQRTAVMGLGVIFVLFLIGGGILMSTSRAGRSVGLALMVGSFVMHGLPALIGILSWKRLSN